MNCMYCGAQAGHESVCPVCGNDLSLQIRTVQISDSLYNKGLDLARIRDLSGAAATLERALKYNKRNLAARNLLGLVYFEMGEAVAALSEWVISKNLMPTGNLASEYIEKVRSDPAKLDTIHLTISRYNRALEACRDGNEDIAEIMLKKVISSNPNLIKASHLLALICIKKKQYEKARRVLLKTIPIDKANPTTFRFLKEIDEQTGRKTDTSASLPVSDKKSSKNSFINILKRSFKSSKKAKEDTDDLLWDGDDYLPDASEEIIHPQAYHETSAFGGILYIALGLIMGALVLWFLVVPSVRQDASRKANDRITQYSTVVAAQTRTIDELVAEIDNYEETANNTNALLDTASQKQNSSESLFKAYEASVSGDYETAMEILSGIDSSLLSTDGAAMYNSLLASVNVDLQQTYRDDGVALYNEKKYDEALDKLLKAYDLNPTDYTTLIYLGHTYRYLGKRTLAIKYFQEVVEIFSDEDKVKYAAEYIGYLTEGLLTDEDIEADRLAKEAEAKAAAEAAAAEAARQQTEAAAAQAQAQAEAEAAAQQQAEQQQDGQQNP